MLIREYKQKIEELEFELEQKNKIIEELKEDIKTDRNYYENNFVSTSKISNIIRRLEYQRENEYCDFAIMILNMLI